jgi:hypothetical protein
MTISVKHIINMLNMYHLVLINVSLCRLLYFIKYQSNVQKKQLRGYKMFTAYGAKNKNRVCDVVLLRYLPEP